jgi:phosphoglycerate-specific signal transduction histidine kinase
MYEIYKELKKLLKQVKVTDVDFCKNTLNKSSKNLLMLFNEKKIRTELIEHERGILQNIESWIISQLRSSLSEFDESPKQNKLNEKHSNYLSKDYFSDDLNIQDVRHNMNKLKKLLNERIFIKI